MDIAKQLATIDLLCGRHFPAEPGRTETGRGGPGYLIAELTTSGDFREDGGSAREEAEAQFEAERDGLSERLAARWGPPHVISLYSAFERTTLSEGVDEPWASLSAHVRDVHVWHLTGTDRWIALGISQWDRELPFQLLAVITETAPV
ncbi:hypothetical protein [Streptomyces sp. YIM S03343]